MEIRAIPLRTDNYAWLLCNHATKECAVVDPSEGESVWRFIQQAGLSLRAILATHHHGDHIGGVETLVELAAGLGQRIEIYASQYDFKARRIPCATRALDDGEQLSVIGSAAAIMSVPGHTHGSIAYYFAQDSAAFTGDTLFTGGCGRLFEGTAQQLFTSLCRIAALPPDTEIFCGHEYTERNLQFAFALEPNNARIAARLTKVAALRRMGKPTVPASLAEELATNPFLRCGEPVVQKAMGHSDPEKVFALLRQKRNDF